MNCFYHQDLVAVGSCKSCGKGLCSACAVDLEKGLACRNHCESDVRTVINVMEGVISRMPVNEHVLASVRRNRYKGAAFYILLGLTFLGFGIYRYNQGGYREPAAFLAITGLLFTGFGIVALRTAKRIPSNKS